MHLALGVAAHICAELFLHYHPAARRYAAPCLLPRPLRHASPWSRLAALNERARRVARAHGMLLLDVERMMQPLPLAKTLWDVVHLHHNYSVRLGKLVLAAAAVEAHRSASSRVDVFTRPRGRA